MKQFSIHFFCLCIFFSWNGILSAQHSVKLDSLKQVIASSKPDSLKAMAWNEISILYRTKGEVDSSRFFAMKGLALAKKVMFRNGEAKSLYYLGILSYKKGDYLNALDTLSKAATIFKDNGNKKDFSSVLTVIGGVKNAMGDLSGALEYQLQSVRIKEEIGDSANLASSYNNLGNFYMSNDEFEKALTSFKIALKLNLKYRNTDRIPDNYYSIAAAYKLLKNNSLAYENVKIAIHLADSIGLVESLTYSYNLMAGLKLDQGEYDSAIVYCLKGITICDKINDPRMKAALFTRLGTVYRKMKDVGKAEHYLLQALEISESINYLEGIIEIEIGLSQLYEENGNYEKALFYFKKYRISDDSLANFEKGKELTKKEMNFEFEKKNALEKLEQDKKDAVALEKAKNQRFVTYSVSILLFFVIIFLVFLYNRYKITQKQKTIIAQQKTEVEQQRDQVNFQNVIIQEKNKSITDSINYAQRIQKAMLPSDELFQSLLPSSFIFFRPKDIVSGDYYWITELNDCIFYATADSTGHGVPGGFMSVLGASLLNEIINEKKISEPSIILDLMKEKIISALRQKGEAGENKDGMDMVLCRLNKKTKELSFAAANNPVWLVRDGKLTEYKADKQSVGIGTGNAKPFSQQTIQLQKNDIVYTITDGFADQFGGPKGKKFKYSELKGKLVSNANENLETQKNILGKEFDDWKGILEQVDDVLIIGIAI